jgi:putative endonuclease
LYYVYALRSQAGGRRYVGSCEDVAKRIEQHNRGTGKSTRHGVPWTLIYTESFATRAEAVRRERYYKTGKGRDELDRLQV